MRHPLRDLFRWIAAGLVAATVPANACETALALTVDVSGSISPTEYRLQMDGIADALLDPTIGDAIIGSEVALLLVQWSGSSRQAVVMDWRQPKTLDELVALASEVREIPRTWRHFSTAIGEALEFTALQFSSAPDCQRRVIDVSGDGYSNEGQQPADIRDMLSDAGFTINGLPIETSVAGLTDYYELVVIGGPGAFAITARNYADYPRAIRRKMLNELTKPGS